ncbi:MAG: hypothetical protein AAB553_07960 [Patescibacteria group bacterium]
MKQISPLTHTISHDFKNLLANIQANAGIIHYKLSSTERKKVVEQLKNIEKKVHEINSLLKQLEGDKK